MDVEQHHDGWWVVGDPRDTTGEGYGPHHTKAEALDCMRAVKRFHRYKNEPGFITHDDSPQKEDKDK